jgi:hypothetical protein
MGKISENNRLKRQNTNRQFPALSSTPTDIRCRELTEVEKTRLQEMLGTPPAALIAKAS